MGGRRSAGALRSIMKRTFILLGLAVCAFLLAPWRAVAGNLSLPPGTDAILEHIYSGRSDLAIPEAQILQHAQPEHPLGYLLEAEARWWQIWCLRPSCWRKQAWRNTNRRRCTFTPGWPVDWRRGCTACARKTGRRLGLE